MSHPLSKAADLKVFEIIAILLYTGPMVDTPFDLLHNTSLFFLKYSSDVSSNDFRFLQFKIYETILRQYPMNKYLDMKIGGNLFSTTIHVLVSGISKLAPLTPKPEPLYRGIRDLNSFGLGFEENGFIERGFLSSTESHEIAMGYSSGTLGQNSKRPALLMIFAKRPSDVLQVCAKVDFLSQSYEDEAEYLFLPLMYLEIKARPKRGNLITIIEVYAKSLLHVVTIEQIEKVRTSLRHAVFFFFTDILIL
jgi:hypothetical protein